MRRLALAQDHEQRGDRTDGQHDGNERAHEPEDDGPAFRFLFGQVFPRVDLGMRFSESTHADRPIPSHRTAGWQDLVSNRDWAQVLFKACTS